MRSPKKLREIVLVGGGHSHVQVLRSFAMKSAQDSHLTVVLDVPVAVYSGMVPGFVAGQYAAHELEIDVVPLARRANARVILSKSIGVDPVDRRIHLEDRPAIRYDAASFDIGSTVAGQDLPGVREHALPTRPIGRFVRQVDRFLERVRSLDDEQPLRVIVAGAGAGGVELAFTFEQRLRKELVRPLHVLLLEGGPRILSSYSDSLVDRVHRQAERRGIEIRCNQRVTSATSSSVELDDGKEVPCDLLVWVTGAIGYSLFAESGLTTDERGFVLTRSTLQVEGHEDLFAVGDCATLRAHPKTPKAGVYAVRQGPYLAANLCAFLAGKSLRRYRPQRDFLTLLNLGDGGGVGCKWGRSVEGRWVMGLKDRIDRRFMRRFQILEPDGSLAEAFRPHPDMSSEMNDLCGGCAAKLGRTPLDQALARLNDILGPGPEDPALRLGLNGGDDAAAYSIGDGHLVVSSFDAFRVFTDDPYVTGRIAAINAISDLQAKGVAPRFAQAVVALRDDLDQETNRETLFQLLAGARVALDPLGVTLLGGHTITAAELLIGFHVEGLASETTSLLSIDRLEVGQELILTKPLGTGVIFHADMKGRARGDWVQSAIDSMARDNGSASKIALAHGATAATDISGFGLAGHLAEMCRASRVSAVIDLDAIPALAGAVELLASGERSTSHDQNKGSDLFFVSGTVSDLELDLLFDPQTSGGLLFGVPAELKADCLEALEKAGERAASVGRVTPLAAVGAPIEVRPERP